MLSLHITHLIHIILLWYFLSFCLFLYKSHILFILFFVDFFFADLLFATTTYYSYYSSLIFLFWLLFANHTSYSYSSSLILSCCFCFLMPSLQIKHTIHMILLWYIKKTKTMQITHLIHSIFLLYIFIILFCFFFANQTSYSYSSWRCHQLPKTSGPTRGPLSPLGPMGPMGPDQGPATAHLPGAVTSSQRPQRRLIWIRCFLGKAQI